MIGVEMVLIFYTTHNFIQIIYNFLKIRGVTLTDFKKVRKKKLNLN